MGSALFVYSSFNPSFSTALGREKRAFYDPLFLSWWWPCKHGKGSGCGIAHVAPVHLRSFDS